MDQYRIISNAQHLCGECPIWDAKNRVFIWTDMLVQEVYRFDTKTNKTDTIAKGQTVGGIALNKIGGFVCSTHNGVFIWDQSDGYKLIIDQYEDEILFCNDGLADPMGRYLFGTVFYDVEKVEIGYPLGKLYKMEKDRSVSILDEGIHLSNGLGFSPDMKTLYYSDTVQKVIFSYDYNVERGTVSNRRVFVKVPADEGMPDGMTVDAEGFVWSAQWYGSCVVRYDPDGKVERVLKTPAKQTTSLIFGGEDLTDIYITTAAKIARLHVAPKGFDFNAADMGGPVYVYNLGIKGKADFMADIQDASREF